MKFVYLVACVSLISSVELNKTDVLTDIQINQLMMEPV